ncbi:serine/threonine-protein phosphatase PGAM5, mitochondrial isoform X2 [Parus major]|uniref:serine/threonine-protein phosphatase PGAM5, mitochondrial isoform X2 n=1 Tax=Pseudopodoces humilis TaxID=181119 RepID=UPI00039597A2|nr:PREDICTED: serine/threonine-protein phosphatase PGAM5, mitochondrial isoform X2 [Pseudopodoces humilis]XP_015499458.1 serine/threonine-protein phosphatase PGAM5, mitochondrial isoform X2 [Parus major]XP_058707267.1 serine/threonine-protein phosphatase PGAM5, mitochondrial isoform X2 [Poecile atricapillus]
MSVRRALALAACGLAGGSVLLSAVVVGKQPARGGGDSEPRPGGSAVPSAAPPGLLLLPPTTSCPPTAGWIERPAGSSSYWDSNWDRREPLALINLKKKNEETGEEELASRLDHCKAKATRHIFLIRHSQYNLDGRADKDRTLTPLGREQAELTGHRLASLGLKFDQIIHSSMTRATETTEIISKHLPGVKKISTDLLREGAPIEPDPPVSHWKPEAVYYEDGARIEAAFRNFIHRADAKQEEDSYEIFVCHANVIRYIVCRALQFPPEGWLRLSLNNGSITHLVIRPNGRVALRTLGDTGFMPPDKITRT